MKHNKNICKQNVIYIRLTLEKGYFGNSTDLMKSIVMFDASYVRVLIDLS